MKLIMHKDRLIGGDGKTVALSDANMCLETGMLVAVRFADRRGDPQVSGTSFRKFELSKHGVQVAKVGANGQGKIGQ